MTSGIFHGISPEGVAYFSTVTRGGAGGKERDVLPPVYFTTKVKTDKYKMLKSRITQLSAK